MKTILCPCDFSATALNGIEFAASVARQINGTITLCHVQPSIWPEAVFMEPIVEESVEVATEKMALIEGDLKKQFGINANSINPRSTDTVEGIIGSLSENYDLIIMGTNGVDDVFQYVFGSTSFNVAKNSLCPVIVIPENYTNQIPKGVIYLHRENINPELDILVPLWWSQIMNIPFGIWISPSGDEPTDKQLIRSIKEELKAGSPENLISFVEVQSISEQITTRVEWMRALAINRHYNSGKNSGISNLRKITTTGDTPLLIFGVEN